MNNYPDIDYCFTKDELFNLLLSVFEIGKQKEKEDFGKESKYISKNKAEKKYTKTRVRNWIEDGDIKVKRNGNGKTSTQWLTLSELMALDASETIKIRKPYKKKIA